MDVGVEEGTQLGRNRRGIEDGEERKLRAKSVPDTARKMSREECQSDYGNGEQDLSEIERKG